MVPRVYHPGATSPTPRPPDDLQDPNLRVIDGLGSKIDSFNLEFDAAVIENQDFTSSHRRLTWDQRAAILRHLYTPDSQWRTGKCLMPKTQAKRRIRHTTLKEYELIGSTLYRKAQEKIKKNGQVIQVPPRRVILDDDVYHTIKTAHVNLGHQGRDKLFKEIESNYFHISRREITWFIENCRYCVLRKRSGTRAPLTAIPDKAIHYRV